MRVKLLLVTTVPETLEFFFPFSRYFQAQGWQVDGMACQASCVPGCVAAFNQTWDVNLSRNPLNPKNLVEVPEKIKKIVQRECYDIIHVFTPVAAFVTRYALRNLPPAQKPKVVYTALGFHFYKGGNFLKNWIFLALEKIAGKWTDCLILVNQEDQNAAHKYNIVFTHKIHYVPSGIGIDLEKFSCTNVSLQKVTELRQEIGLKPNDSLFLSVAEFIPRKNPQDVIRAFSKLSNPATHLAFAGKGIMLPAMKHLAKELRIEDRVHFLGHRHDIPALMQLATAVVLASEQEGLPISVIEAMCMQTPVIATNIRGTQDLLEGGCGYLVPLASPARLTEAMEWLLSHPDDAIEIGKSGKREAQIYDVKNILTQQESIYQELLGLSDINRPIVSNF